MTKNGYVITDANMETNIPGIFAAGDVRDKVLRQVATCVGDAAIAGVMAEKYIAEGEIFEDQIMSGNGVVYVYDVTHTEQREFLSKFEGIEEKYPDYIYHKVDTFKSKGLMHRLHVKECPSVVIIKDGTVSEILDDCCCDERIQSRL
jgi:thioredoxin reductase (NADPH)